MKQQRLHDLITAIRDVNIAVYGDFCLDAYWHLHPDGGEISVETGRHSEAVSRHYYTLGGAANVVANLAALKPSTLRAIGAIGPDLFGGELRRQLEELGTNTDDLFVQRENFETVTFAKRYLGEEELARIDFGFFNQRSSEIEAEILSALRRAFEECDAVILNQQVPGSLGNPSFIPALNKLIAEYPEQIILLDSRHYGDAFRGVCRKVNAVEAGQLCGHKLEASDPVSRQNAQLFAAELYQREKRPVFLTRGSKGILVQNARERHEIPGIQNMKRVDTVGAGDTTISALAAALATEASPQEAAEFANEAATVTVQKLFCTGTASPEEIMAQLDRSSYIYQPELADDPRLAKYAENSEMELCFPQEKSAAPGIKHIIFDHDGTISTLREGWEHVMEPMMIEAIMGSHFTEGDEALYRKIRDRVQKYIDKSTGIQTILQMEALVEMVREFGLVRDEKILDKHGYKQRYNQALLEMIHLRMEKFERGELGVGDFTIKGAVEFLASLRQAGIHLYLASGTDHDDVVAEATALGYAHFFDGGIFGSVGDVSKYSKRMVIENILAKNNLEGNELAVIGDGPVEMQQCRRHNGFAIGIASDEIRRYGLNPEKRSRLIRAGANVVLPDFSRAAPLLELLS